MQKYQRLVKRIKENINQSKIDYPSSLELSKNIIQSIASYHTEQQFIVSELEKRINILTKELKAMELKNSSINKDSNFFKNSTELKKIQIRNNNYHDPLKQVKQAKRTTKKYRHENLIKRIFKF